MAHRTADDSWHLDRKVPVAIILAVLTQTAMFGWYASKLDSRISALERLQERNVVTDRRQYDRINDFDRIVAETNARLAKMEGILQQMSKQLESLDRKIERKQDK